MHSIVNAQITAILTGLVRINNERIQWYDSSLQRLRPEDKDLVSVFETNRRKIHNQNEFLMEEIRDLDEHWKEGSTEPKTAKAAMFAGKNRHAVLMNCEAGEIGAQQAFQKALDNPQLPGYIKELLGVQMEEMERMYQRVRSLKTTAF